MKHFDLDIKLDGLTDLWGKYTLNFPICTSETANDGLLPYGAIIASVILKVYQGNVDEKTNIDNATLIPGVVEDSPVIVAPNKVTFFIQHPGKDYLNIKASLVIEITLANGSKNSFYGSYIYIGWAGE